MSNAEIAQPQTNIFEHHPFWLKLCLILMFLLAALIRRDEIRAPGHLLDREYTSAIFARAFYFRSNAQVEDWRRDIAVITMNQQPVLEPPLVEYLVSLIYRVMGREEIYYARFLTGAFWLAGGIFMYLITKKLLSTEAAFFATLYYLFAPMGVIISRSFQPDSLMMMLFLISLYALVLYFEKPSLRRLLLAAVFTGITLLLRPLVSYAIFCAFLALSLYQSKNWKKIIDLPLIIFSVVSLLPSLIYYGYGIIFAGFMRWKVSNSFMPYLLVKKDFWLGWSDIVINVAGFTPLLLALLGFFLLGNRRVQYLVIGLVVSFMLFTVTFTYHIHTHPYYHIQLFPIIGLSASPIIVETVKSIMQRIHSIGRFWWIPVVAALLFVPYVAYREVRNSLYQIHMEDPAVAREIGELINHSPRAVYVANYYGVPLEYYGEFGGAPWPVRIEDEFYRQPGEQERTVQQRLDALSFTPEYFVITDFQLFFRLHQDLQAFLDKNCSRYVHKDSYWIYRSCDYSVLH